MRQLRHAAPAALFLFALACGQGAVLRGRIQGTREIADQAERNGARVCAPRELAVARANLEFAEREIEQGDPIRAQQHFDLAEPNARAAMRLTDPQRCLEHEPEPPPPPAPGDRDGDGILDPDDQCPDVPEDRDGHDDQDGCPETEDSDGDGLDDDHDLCPAEPEDVDGYQDTDGCPEPDNDVDGILDGSDHCPLEPEDRDGHRDDDGCPDRDNDGDSIEDVTDQCPNEPGLASDNGCPRVYQDVEVTSEGIVIHQQVFFVTDRATIRPESHAILDTVAQVMRDFPDITIEVQGHTDSRGNDRHNMTLSQQRADSVRTYLMAQGISGDRMTARGYGETVPIEDNSTDYGRSMNRRVEFHRTDARASQ
jgi:outer membrane protein OmpA-like peptidoglycan-associated protein